jgi:hypothetical protein
MTVDTGREHAVALITAALNELYGDGDALLFRRALADVLTSTLIEDAVRELARCAGMLANMNARKDDLETLEWWSAVAERFAIEGPQDDQRPVTPVMRAAYSLAACSVVANDLPGDTFRSEAERDLLLSQLSETINALRRLRHRVA